MTISVDMKKALLKDLQDAITNVKVLYSTDLNETADAVENIGFKLRTSCDSGNLMLAAAILNRASSANG